MGPYFISSISPLFRFGLFGRHSIGMYIHIYDGKMIHKALLFPKFRVIKYKSKSFKPQCTSTSLHGTLTASFQGKNILLCVHLKLSRVALSMDYKLSCICKINFIKSMG